MTCRCGHKQARHLFQHGPCLHATKQEGDTMKHCRCSGFEVAGAVPARKPRVDFDLGTTGGDG